MALTHKQQLFVEHYVQCWNATRAAKLAGYRGNGKTVAEIGHQNLGKLGIKELISERLKESAMDADECLSRIAGHARCGETRALKALELVGKHHSLFTDKIEHTVSIDVSNLTNDQLEHLVKHGRTPA